MQSAQIVIILFLFALIFPSCQDGDRFDREVEIPTFSFGESITFEEQLSSYEIFEGDPSDLLPTSAFQLLELNAELFTDYASKQRLVRVPEGSLIVRGAEGSTVFPDGSILTKTFYYEQNDVPGSGDRDVIETRLLIKEDGVWNIATYVWNEDQSDAMLTLDGYSRSVAWESVDGSRQSTIYQVPSHNECKTCHQSDGALTTLGPKMANLNRDVTRDGRTLNQLDYLQDIGLLTPMVTSDIDVMVDYKDGSLPLEDRARAYLGINCAHCHNPAGWEEPASRDFDFRYDTPFGRSGIQQGRDRILEAVSREEMPFIGTTVLDVEGLSLLEAYVKTLD